MDRPPYGWEFSPHNTGKSKNHDFWPKNQKNVFFGGFRPLTNANTNLKGKNAQYFIDINIYKKKKYQQPPSTTFGHMELPARLPELGKYKSPQTVD